MGRRAVLYLPGPSTPGQKLHIQGVRVDQQRAEGALHLTVIIDGERRPLRTIEPGQREFQFDYDLRSELVGRTKVEIGLVVDKALHYGRDDRELGLVLKEVDLR
jgi:YD repeat-containing protein